MEKTKVTVGFAPGHFLSHCVVLSMPSASDGRMCVLHQFRWSIRSVGLMDQVHQVAELAQRYEVMHLGVEDSDLGRVALDMLREFFPALKVTDRRDVEMSDAYLCALDLDRRSRSTSTSVRSAW